MPGDNRRPSRRRTLASIGAIATAAVLPTTTSAGAATSAYEADVRSIMSDYDINGVSTAIVSPNGPDVAAPVYRKAIGTNQSYWYGTARKHEPLTPDHRLRLASVTKTLTSAAILRMIDFDYLSASDRVFGANAILHPDEWGRPNSDCPLTVSHFLDHAYEIKEEQSADWTRAVHQAPPDLSLKQTVQYIHREFTVGTTSSSEGRRGFCERPDEYYNYGFGVLAAVVDTLYRDGGYADGRGFEAFVKDYLLTPAGARGMDTVGTHHGDVENEAYHHSSDGNPYAKWLARERAWGWAGWAGTALEVARFGQHAVTATTFPSTVVGDYTELAGYGWVTYGEEPYVGHDGTQVGVLATLRCHPERTFCVLINTRHRESWDGDPRDAFARRTRELAEELV